MDAGLFEFLTQFVTPHKLDLFDRVLRERTRFLCVVLEDLFQPHNASACIRSCDCFGVQDVHVIENRNEFNMRIDVAAGSERWLNIHRHDQAADNTTACIDQLRASGYQIVATTPNTDAVSVRDFPLQKKSALFFGSEQFGVSDTVLREADAHVRVPMRGFTESFNISVAVALALYKLTERLRLERDDWRLSSEEIRDIKHTWVEGVLRTRLAPLTRRYQQDLAKAENDERQ